MKKFLILLSSFFMVLCASGAVYALPFSDVTIIEPAAILLFGTGLIGIATVTRNSRFLKK